MINNNNAGNSVYSVERMIKFGL